MVAGPEWDPIIWAAACRGGLSPLQVYILWSPWLQGLVWRVALVLNEYKVFSRVQQGLEGTDGMALVYTVRGLEYSSFPCTDTCQLASRVGTPGLHKGIPTTGVNL